MIQAINLSNKIKNTKGSLPTPHEATFSLDQNIRDQRMEFMDMNVPKKISLCVVIIMGTLQSYAAEKSVIVGLGYIN